MKERPILFSGEMVKAILDGRKTQTRRIVKIPQWMQKMSPDLSRAFPDNAFGVTPCLQVPCAYEGDPSVQRLRNPWMWPEPSRLWIRESWTHYDIWKPGPEGYGKILYKATDELGPYKKWHPSIHMFRGDSRINLEITNVRVERLECISHADARAEGMVESERESVTDAFHNLWDKINGKKHPWSSNPWVWVIEFRRISAILSADNVRA